MSAQDDTYTFDRLADDGGPYVPDVDDLGGAEIADDPQNPPQKGAEPYGGMFNEVRRNVAGLNRCNWWATIWVEYDSPNYSVTAVDCMGTLPVIGDFSAATGATGEVVISWPAGTLPAMARKPHAWTTDDFGLAGGAVTGPNEITVYVKDIAGSDADMNFAVELR
jgi:hypothetical protein